MAAQTQLRHEVLNPRRRYGKDIEWKLFSRWRPPSDVIDGMPPKWIRLFDFPHRVDPRIRLVAGEGFERPPRGYEPADCLAKARTHKKVHRFWAHHMRKG